MSWAWFPSRCTTATRTGITFPLNQVVFDTDLQRFYVGDGSTAGGVVVGSGTGEANTASNTGVAGVGVFARKTGVDIELKNLNAGSNKISIVDDTGNDEIDIDVNEGNLSIAGSQLTGTVTIDGSIPTGGTAGQVLEKIDGTNYNVQWATPSGGSGEVNTGSNLGAGIGVFSGKVGVDLQFHSLVSQNNLLTVALDAGNEEVDLTVNQGNIDHDSLSNFVGDEHVAHSGVSITAGSGLTGGGNISATRTIDVGAGAGITVNADDVALADAKAWSIKLRNAGTSGALTDADETDLTEELAPASGDWLLGWDAAGQIRRFDVGNLPTGGGGEANTGSSLGAGIAVFSGKSGIDLQFHSLVSQNGLLTIALDGPNEEVDFTVNEGSINHDNLAGFVGDEHVAHGSVSITAGNGLTGGGTIAATRTLDIGAGTGITVNANDVAITAGGVGTTQLADEGVTLAKMAHMATDSFLGRDTAATGDVEVLSAATARAILNVADGAEPKPSLRASVTLIDPVATDDGTLFFTPVAITVTDVRSHITGTTNVVFNIQHASTRTGTGLNVFTSNITLTSTAGQSNNTGFNDATIPANSWVWVEIASVSGTPSRFHATVVYTED